MKQKLTFILLLMVTLILASCSKESQPSSYTITNQTGIDGTVFVHECTDAGETVFIQNATIKNGSSKTFTANDKAVKVKIYIEDLDRWVQQVYYLEGSDTKIVINGQTIVGRQEP